MAHVASQNGKLKRWERSLLLRISAAVEAGAGDAGSCASALAKALTGAAAAALGFLFTGFAFMFGNGSSGLVGAEGFFLSGTADNAVSVALQGFQYAGSFTALADFPVPLAAKVLLFSAAVC